MAKKVFFSFHYGNDINRANTVRNSWVFRGTLDAGFVDKAEFEKIKRQGDSAVKRWIERQLSGTSTTVVLIGKETLNRPYVQYEIEQSYKKGNAIIGVNIGGIKDMETNLTCVSQSPIKIIGKNDRDEYLWFNKIASDIYDYKKNDGYNNLGRWIKQAKSIRI